MKKRYKNFCNNDDSTSTINQRIVDQGPIFCVSPYLQSRTTLQGSEPTLEEMIIQLDLEEKAARRAKFDEYGEMHHRMSCVNSSDILRTARNALNQYPRFSLDGKDAMYRSSFRSLAPISNHDQGLRTRLLQKGADHSAKGRTIHLPATLAGERVVWCRPGVVAKLMGLEAMPLPLSGCHRRRKREALAKEMGMKRRGEKDEMEKSRSGLKNNGGGKMDRRQIGGSCSRNRQSVLKPWGLECPDEAVGWPMRRFL